LYKKDYFKEKKQKKKQNKKQNKKFVQTFKKIERRTKILSIKMKALVRSYIELNTKTFLAKKGNTKLNVYPRYFRY